MSILSTIEVDIEALLLKAWGFVKGEVVAEAHVLINDGAALLGQILPANYSNLKPIIQRVQKDVTSGNPDDLLQAVVQGAEVAGLDFVKGMPELSLKAIIALVAAL
jgi:hypothetical protein